MRRLITTIVIMCIAMGVLAKDEVDKTAEFQQQVALNSYPIKTDGTDFTGEGWDLLVQKAANSHYFAIGEEHGIAENPKMAAALFEALVPAGYRHLAIEVSPPLAEKFAEVTSGGLAGMQEMYRVPANRAAFFSMKEEAQMLVDIRRALPEQADLFWGLDYEVLGERFLINELLKEEHPESAKPALEVLSESSNESWKKFDEEKNPAFIYSFAGSPDLIENIQKSWPDPGARANSLMFSLKETFAINQLWISGQYWQSNVRRAQLFRTHWLNYWNQLQAENPNARIMIKLGSNHLIRGLNYTRTFDLGSLLPALAEMEGKSLTQLMVIPGKGSLTAKFNPVTMQYAANDPKDGYHKGLEIITDNIPDEGFTLIALEPLRALVHKHPDEYSDKLEKVVFGYDYLLVMTGSTSSTNLLPDWHASPVRP